MFHVSSERVRYLLPEEEQKLFEKLDRCEWLKAIVLFALHTGMRRGEICGLQWRDLKLRSWAASCSEYEER
jgi:integrase